MSLAKLRSDLLGSKEETHASIQEGQAYKQQAGKVEVELEGVRQHEKILTEQVEQQDAILTQLQAELKVRRLGMIVDGGE